ncbi:MAG: hypothetical protein AMJ79_01505 [Phycisphaerae bacterium SM23_30]|nr:MAG: hypothetical protein AMJ79_01505 [Phycisphaerae bacterium SM23_30]
MPGLNFLFRFDGDLASRKTVFTDGPNRFDLDFDYKNIDQKETSNWVLSCHKYPEYPTTIFDDDELYIYLEGKIYNKDHATVSSELKFLARNIFTDGSGAAQRLRSWLLDVDGDFIVFCWNKLSGQIALFNDVLGRLPLYYYHTESEVAVSRNLKFLADAIKKRQYDMMSMAQYLLIGYCPHHRTLLKNIYRLSPAGLLEIDGKRSRCSIKNVHVFNFENKPHQSKSTRENASELARLMGQGVKNRAESSAKNILSLSGGLDSRTVGAALYAQKIPFEAATFIDYEKARQLDIDCARDIAKILDCEHAIVPLSAPTGENFLRLLRIKNGRNYLGISFLLQFLEYLKQRHGRNFTYFTGNGGDRIARDIRPNLYFQDMDELTAYICRRQQFFPEDELSALVQISKEKIRQEVKEILQSYPENDLVQKFIHFEVHGDALTRHVEGDDRTKHFFWTATPYYSVPFFQYIMGIPDEQKRDFKLYKVFLDQLHFELVAIPYANIVAPVGSFRHKTYNLIRRVRKWPNPVRFCLRKLNLYPAPAPPQHIHSPHFIDCFRQQIETCTVLSDYFSRPGLEKIISHPQNYKNEALEVLFTATSMMEYFECGKSTLEKFLSADLSVPSGSWDWYRHKILNDKA